MRYYIKQKLLQQGVILLGLFFSTVIYGNNVENILREYNQKNALSQKTIDENKGHLFLFSREKLEKMHAKTLKDVFKTTPIIYYHENRLALPYPLTSGAFEPYKSNFVRLYIDGVEVTQGWMGSGLMLYGDINIDFVDHIEFYYAVPSFEASVEPAYMTIFLYSKNPKYDNGGKLSLLGGSRGYNSQSFAYGEQTEDFAYMVNLSYTNAKRETIDNGTSKPLSRNFERTQLFSYVKTEDQIFHLQIMKKNTQSLAGMSLDATPLISQIDYLNIHMDYGVELSEYWRAQFSYDWLKTDLAQADDFPLFWPDALGENTLNAVYKNSTYSGELTYKRTMGNNYLSAGIKARYKVLDSFRNNGKNALFSSFTSEKIATAFFQNQYALSEQELLTVGISHNHIIRNGGVENDSLLQLRLGYIYTSNHWSYKAYIYRAQFALEALSRYLYPIGTEKVEPQTTLAVTHELAYNNDNYKLRFMLLLMQDEDSLIQYGTSNATKYFFSLLDYDYDFDLNNKINFQLNYANYRNIASVDKLEDISGYLSFINSYEKFDFYNGLIWRSNSLDWKNYFDLTSSVSWNIDKDITLTVKGQNLLNKAKKTNLFRVSPTTGALIEPLNISPIDQRITLELEYFF